MKRDIPAIFFDGAFGTYYFELTKDDQPCEFANLNREETVLEIHRQYIKAGAKAIKTNTFGVNSLLCEDKIQRFELLSRGFALAKEAVKNKQIAVFADIGPLNALSEEEQTQEYLEIAQAFLDLGAENFIFETFSEINAVLPALEQIKKNRPEAYIILSFAVSQDGYTTKGLYYKDLLRQAAASPYTDAVGLNCICGPSHMLELIKNLGAIGKTLCAMPNSGYPLNINGRTVFRDNAQYFADRLGEIQAAGAEIIGGCCGTTPTHIALVSKKLSEETPKEHTLAKNTASPQSRPLPMLAITSGEKKLIAVELDPPTDTDCSFILEAAREIKNAGADMLTMADSPLARVRADSIMTAAKIKREIGIEVLPHLSCRDKNHIALKGLLLGAAMENLNRVLIITGDPILKTEHKKTNNVFAFNSFELISFINSLNKEALSASPLLIGAALNINALNFDNELRRAEKKQQMGANFFLTQAIFSPQAVENCKKAKEVLNLPIFAGVLPLASYKNALFLQNEVTGIEIPPQVINALKDKSPQEVYEISLAYSMDIIHQVYPYCDGIYIMTPIKRVDLVCGLIKKIQGLPKINA